MQAVEEWDDNAGSAEHDKRLLIERDVERGGFHPTSLTGPTDFSLGTARRALSAPLIVQLLMALNCKRARPNPRRLTITTARRGRSPCRQLSRSRRSPDAAQHGRTRASAERTVPLGAAG